MTKVRLRRKAILGASLLFSLLGASSIFAGTKDADAETRSILASPAAQEVGADAYEVSRRDGISEIRVLSEARAELVRIYLGVGREEIEGASAGACGARTDGLVRAVLADAAFEGDRPLADINGGPGCI